MAGDPGLVWAAFLPTAGFPSRLLSPWWGELSVPWFPCSQTRRDTMKRLAIALFVGACVTGLALTALAQGGNKIAIGDPASSFSGLPGIDGKDHSLAEYSN